MLVDQDVLLLKLALEWELIDAKSYRTVVETVRKAPGVGRALRQAGVAGERVGALAELVATQAGSGVILARCDLEDEILAKAIERSKLLPAEKIGKARDEVRGLARIGEVASLSEVLVKRRWVEVPVAVEMRRRARERVATCPRCRKHYVVDPATAVTGKVKCSADQQVLLPGKGCPSAVDAARGTAQQEAKPAPMPDASQMFRLSPQQMAELKATAEAGKKAEAEREAARGVVPPPVAVGPAPVTPPTVPGRPAPAPGTSTVRRLASSPNNPALGTAQTTLSDKTPGRVDVGERTATGQRRSPDPGAGERTQTQAQRRTPDPAPGTGSTGERTQTRGLNRPTPQPPHGDLDERTKRAHSETQGGEEVSPLLGAGGKAKANAAAPQAARWESVDELEDDAPIPAAVATFGDYEIIQEIARGGMGIVYKARRAGSPKLLALKVLISGVDATEEQVRRFEREGEAARRLRHDNIVRIYDAGRHEGYHYIAMEFVEGKPLDQLLAQGALEPKRAATILGALARAAHHMHENKIVHRDLKPGNVLLDAQEKPKLIDFGLAKTIDRSAKLTRSGAAIGTPYYMPPEQVRGDAAAVGPRSDVYSLGAILYELIVGDVPFKAENPIELYHKIASSELVLPSALKKGLPPDIETIVTKAMEKRPEDRYESAAALADDLERFARGESVSAARRGSVSRAARSARKHVVIGAIVVLLMIGTGAGVLIAMKLHGQGGGARAQLMVEQGREALARGDAPQARVFLESARAMAPGDARVAFDLARAYAALKANDLALKTVEAAVEAGLDDASLFRAIELDPLREDPRLVECLKRVQARGGPR